VNRAKIQLKIRTGQSFRSAVKSVHSDSSELTNNFSENYHIQNDKKGNERLEYVKFRWCRSRARIVLLFTFLQNNDDIPVCFPSIPEEKERTKKKRKLVVPCFVFSRFFKLYTLSLFSSVQAIELTQPWGIGSADEKLRSVCVWACIGHGTA
jgi:hypothetical protein